MYCLLNMLPCRVDLGASTVVEFQVYRRSRVPLKPGILLARAKKHISDVVGKNCMSSIVFIALTQMCLGTTFSLSSISAAQEVCSLQISCSRGPRAPSLTVGTLLKSTEPMASMFVKLGEVRSQHD